MNEELYQIVLAGSIQDRLNREHSRKMKTEPRPQALAAPRPGMKGAKTDYDFDIAISYAGEDEEIASRLKREFDRRGVPTFFAPHTSAGLLGESLEGAFTQSFARRTRLVAILVSEHYPRKRWTMFELGVALEEEVRRGETVVIPLRLSDIPLEPITERLSLDLRKIELDEAVAQLVERVRIHRGQIAPREEFEKAFIEWKREGFLPGQEKGSFFFENIDQMEIDVDRCEFILKCPSDSGAKLAHALGQIPKEVVLAAGERLVEKAVAPNWKLSAIRYVGYIDPRAAERHLRLIYENPDVDINDRARAFEEMWKCDMAEISEESAKVLLDRETPWQLRRAAAKNLLWGRPAVRAEAVLGRAIHDPRREVRSIVINTILRFRLGSLSPELISVYRKQRSRKGKSEIETALRHFNHRPDVVAFGKEMGLGPAFFRPPVYVHDWETHREGWV